MVNDAQKTGMIGQSEPNPIAVLQALGPEGLRQRVEKLHEAQKRLLFALQNNQLPLSQVAAEMARLESDLAEAQRAMKMAAGIPA